MFRSQRVPRYEMLLREIRKYTPASHPQYRTLEFAFDKIKRVATFINEQKREFESRSKVLQIQQEVTDRPDSLKPLTSDKRSFIRACGFVCLRVRACERGTQRRCLKRNKQTIDFLDFRFPYRYEYRSHGADVLYVSMLYARRFFVRW